MEGEYRGCRNGCANLGCAISIFVGVMAIVLIVNHTLHVFEGLVLVLAGVARNDTWQILSGAVYGTMLVLLYGASTLYHALPPCRAKQVCRFLDHAAIFLLIAGTYTPFTLGALRGPLGFALFLVIWSLAALGIALKASFGLHPRLYVGLYVAMGWLGRFRVSTSGPLPGRTGRGPTLPALEQRRDAETAGRARLRVRFQTACLLGSDGIASRLHRRSDVAQA